MELAAQYHGWLGACENRLDDKVEAVWVDGMKVSHLHHILLAAIIIIIIKCSLGYSLSCVVRGWTPWGEGKRAHFVSSFVQGDQPCLKLSSLAHSPLLSHLPLQHYVAKILYYVCIYSVPAFTTIPRMSYVNGPIHYNR